MAKKKPQSEKDKLKIPKEMPKQRNEGVRQMIQRGWPAGGMESDENKRTRGKGTHGKGKKQRHPKHKKDLSRMAENVSERFLAASGFSVDRE